MEMMAVECLRTGCFAMHNHSSCTNSGELTHQSVSMLLLITHRLICGRIHLFTCRRVSDWVLVRRFSQSAKNDWPKAENTCFLLLKWLHHLFVFPLRATNSLLCTLLPIVLRTHSNDCIHVQQWILEHCAASGHILGKFLLFPNGCIPRSGEWRFPAKGIQRNVPLKK